MNEFNSAPTPQPSGAAGWLPVWIKAVTKPTEQTFVDITSHPDASSKTAYIWVFIAGTVSAIIQAFGTAIRAAVGAGSQLQQIPGLEQYLPETTGGGGGVGIALVSGLCASPVAGLLSIVFFALFVAIIQWVAKLFGGAGSYEKLLYAFAAITVPFTLVSSLFVLLGAIPFVGICTGILSLGLSIYSIVLQVTAVKAVNRFGWGQAAGSVFLPGLVLIFVCACIVGISLMLLGPMIGDAFNNINQGLQFAP